MEKIKVTVAREDGKLIHAGSGEDVNYLTDQNPVLIVRKDGGTVETFSPGGMFDLLQFTVRQLEGLGVKERNELYEAFGLERNYGKAKESH